MELNICHLYPEVLNLYGDRGNIRCLSRRLSWRGIDCHVDELKIGEKKDLTAYDLFFIGGGQDFEQEVLLSDLNSGNQGCSGGWEDLSVHLRRLSDDGTLLSDA
jgi:CobQ-like glutamine amidotransferase family enzyme